MNRDSHKHKQSAESYRVRQKQTVAAAEHHINKSTHHIPECHNITHNREECDISLEDIQVQNHAWHIVLSHQIFGRVERGK